MVDAIPAGSIFIHNYSLYLLILLSDSLRSLGLLIACCMASGYGTCHTLHNKKRRGNPGE